MVNPLRGEAAFQAGEKSFTLVFNVNVFCAIEADTGFGIGELIGKVQGAPSFTLLRDIFCAALQPRHRGTSKAQAGDILSDAGMDEATRALTEALAQAMPAPRKDGEGKEEQNPPEEAGGTG